LKTIASFEIKYYQFLDEHGKPVIENMPALASDLDQLTQLYKTMTQVRIFDDKAIKLQRTGKLGTYASSLGHEAIHVGMGSAMKHEDVLAPMYREYGAMMCRGVKMSEILTYWGGNEEGSNFSGPAHDYPICVPIATQCMLASGSAMAFKLRKQPRVAVTIVGDGGSSKGDFLEALNAAGAWQLPVVFVIANNQWAISVPRKKQSGAQTLAQKGLAAGLPSVQVDGNDIVAVRWAMDTAIKRAREGKGASVIECITYRLSDHTTADDASRYRPTDEVEDAWKLEPLIRLKAYLKDQGVWSDDQQTELETECASAVEDAVTEYMNTPIPAITEMFDHMYDELPHDLAQQRAFALETENG